MFSKQLLLESNLVGALYPTASPTSIQAHHNYPQAMQGLTTSQWKMDTLCVRPLLVDGRERVWEVLKINLTTRQRDYNTTTA